MECRVVGVGASAGGIEALQTLLRTLPPSPGFALVILQHLPPEKPSVLAKLLSSWADRPVLAARTGVRPQADGIYLPSPCDIVTIEDGVFRTRPIHDAERRQGIDMIDAFFESLAWDRAEGAIAVVLSGTGNDGTAGAIAVHAVGGVVIVQDPRTASHDAMPGAVIAAGVADHIVPVDQLAGQLVACAATSYERPLRDGSTSIVDGLERIRSLIRHRTGVDLAGYKPSPLLWRIQQRMEARRTERFDDYFALLEEPAELESLLRGIPVHVTEFFRDRGAWDVLDQEVLAPLVEECGATRAVRAWTAACSTGEEAYSLAMLLDERLARHRCGTFQLFVTDASREMLARASRGAFSEASIAPVSVERRARYFYSADRGFRVKRSLREHMVFAPQDLLIDPPFTELDLISCRNLLIYLQPDAADHVLFQLHNALRPGGYLFLGAAEPLLPQRAGFAPVSRRWNIYRKSGPIEAARRGPPVRLSHEWVAALRNVAVRPPPPEPEVAAVSRADLDASRAELQALNKELAASNEQLDVANEDLDRATQRGEEQGAALELQRHALTSGAVMAMFLDDHLHVQWFTPAVAEVIPLRPADAGRAITDLVPRIRDDRFLSDIAAVMHDGQVREAEVRRDDGRWFSRAIRSDLGRTGVAVTYSDITAAKLAEHALRDSEARQTFLLALSDVLRPLKDPSGVATAAARLLVEYLGANRAMYVEIEGQVAVICGQFARDVPPFPARVSEVALGSGLPTELLGTHRTLVVSDTANDARLTTAVRAAWSSAEVASTIACSLIKAGEMVAHLVVHGAVPRVWTAVEVQLVEDVADRTRVAVERCRVESELRASEEKYRSLFESK